MADHYLIKDGYTANTRLLTPDLASGKNYWNKKRIRYAYHYQFDVYRYISKLVLEKNIASVMDVGCGIGLKLRYVHAGKPDLRIIGIDQDNAIRYCKQRHRFGEWYSDDFEQPREELKLLKADLVVSSDVIEHVLIPDKLLEYVRERVNPGGYIVLSTPERDSLRGRECVTSPSKYHIREWNFDEFARYLESRGFVIVEHFLEYPVKFALTKIFYKEVARRFLSGRPVKTNQVCLLQPR